MSHPIANVGQWLWEKVARAHERVIVVSPWLSAAPVERLLKTVPDGVNVRVVFRWPQSSSDAHPLDPAAVGALYDAVSDDVAVEFVDGPLHAKVYVVDDALLITSANFTSAGLNTNHELGLETRPSDDIDERINIWQPRALDQPSYKLLSRLLAQLPASPPNNFDKPPPFRNDGRVGFVDGVLTHCSLSHQHKATGAGQNTWEVTTFRKRNAVGKAHISRPGSSSSYHFEITRRDDAYMKRGTLDGLLLVPTDAAQSGYASPRDAPNLILVSKDALYDRRGLLKRAMNGHKNLSLYLEPQGRGWCLRLPSALRGRGATATLRRAGHLQGWVLTLPRGSWQP